MNELRFTLIGDGPSDQVLLKIIKWLIDDLYPKLPTKPKYADFRHLPNRPKKGAVENQIKIALDVWACDILFYHRDAETIDLKSLETRKREILYQIKSPFTEPIICVIPIKMTETWLLINQEAIKKAAGNRNFTGELILPKITELEKQTQPKKTLHELLKKASGLTGRRLDKFNVNQAIYLVADNITDFKPLRQLEAFKAFEMELKNAIDNLLQP